MDAGKDKQQNNIYSENETIYSNNKRNERQFINELTQEPDTICPLTLTYNIQSTDK